MTATIDWTQTGLIIGALVPLLGLPLTMITLYLRSIRDYQITRYADLEQRLSHLDVSMDDATKLMRAYERDYTTKEEWLRESMHARQQLEKLTQLVTRIQVEIENGNGVAHQLASATQAMIQLTEALVNRHES